LVVLKFDSFIKSKGNDASFLKNGSSTGY